MKITSKRKFKKVLAQMIKAAPCEIIQDYQFVHGENFKMKSFRGIEVLKDIRTPNKSIYLCPKITI
jgi:hypothetical protein